MPCCYAPLLCNTCSKNTGWGVLVPGFIEVVIYSFGIGSLGAFSPLKIHPGHTISMLAGKFSGWINIPSKSKSCSFPLWKSPEMLGGIGRSVPMLRLLLIVMKSTKSRGCASLPGVFQKGGGEKKAQQSTFAARLPFQTCRVWNSAGLLIPRSRRCPREQIQHDDTKA